MHQGEQTLFNHSEAKISVIIPVYNSGTYLKRTIRCLQEQFFSTIEIIFVDDFSTDNSVNIILQSMKTDQRIKLIKNDRHQGAGICRNCGLKVARGEYAIFLDADDYFYPNMLEVTYRYARQEKADVVVFGREVVDMSKSADEDGILSIKYDLYGNRVINGDDVTVKDYNQAAFIPWNKLVRKQFLTDHNISFQDLPANNDIYYSFSVMISAEKIVYVDNILIRYYKNLPQSLTRGRSHKNYLPEAITNCILYARNFAGVRKYKTISEYLLKIIKREIATGTNDEITDKVCRLIKNQDVTGWIDDCIENKTFNHIDILFLQALKCNEINDKMSAETWEAIKLSRLIEKVHSSNKKIALWGCGRRGKKWLELMKHNRINIDYVIDEKLSMQGEKIYGFSVQNYETVKDDIDVIFLAIANTTIISEIKQRVKQQIVLEEGEWEVYV